MPEYEKDYPEPWNFGRIPSWGIFARHAKNLTVRDVTLKLMTADQRPAVILDDVTGADFSRVRLASTEGRPTWSLTKVSDLHASDVTHLADGDTKTIDHAQH